MNFADITLRIDDLYTAKLNLSMSGHVILPAEILGGDSKEAVKMTLVGEQGKSKVAGESAIRKSAFTSHT